MAASLTASFILKLEDKLSAGIAGLTRKLEKLASLGQMVKLSGLDQADRTLNAVGAAAERAGRKVDGIGRSAKSAMAELRRLSMQPIMVNGAGTAFLPPGMSRSNMAGIIAGAAAGAAGGGGLMVAPRGSPFTGGGPALLGGPAGGGGIPLNYNPRLGRPGMTPFAGNVGALEAAVAGLSLEAPIRAAAELDKVLRSVAIINRLSGSAAEADIARLHTVLEKESVETGQPIMKLAETYRDLRNRAISTEVVEQLLPIHGRAGIAYGVDPESMGQAVSALNKNLGIGHEEMGGALAAIAQATHEGTFDFTSMSHFLPTITGRMGMLGMKGRGSLDKVAAALEVVSASSGDPSQTATNFTDMMIAMTQPYARKAFKKVGIDLAGEMTAAEKAGKDPMETYIGILKRMTQGIQGDVAKAFYLGKVLHNQQAGTAALALVQHEQEYLKLRDELHGVTGKKLDDDYGTAKAGLSPQLMDRDAKLKDLEIRLGDGFSWVVPVENALLDMVTGGLGWMLTNFPILTKLALGLAGGMLALVTALGLLTSVEKVMGPKFLGVGAGIAGLRKVLGGVLWIVGRLAGLLRVLAGAFIALQVAGGPILWILEAIAALGLLIWYNWDRIGPYFARLWSFIKSIFQDFWTWLTGWIGGAMQAAIERLKAAWAGVSGFFTKLWTDAAAGLDILISKIQHAVDMARQMLGIGPAPSDGRRDRDGYGTATPGGRTPDENDQRDSGTGMFTPSSYRPAGAGRVGFDPIEIRVTTDGNAKVDAPKRLMPLDRGEMLGASI